jgi:hypothetical protein
MRLDGRTAQAPPTVSARRRRTITALTLAGVVAVGGATTLAGAQTPNFKRLIVDAEKKRAPATLGSHCVPFADGTGGECKQDYTYPLKVSNTLTIRPGGQVTLLLGAPAEFVRWRVARIDGKGEEVITALGEAKAVTKTRKRWRITLPRRISRSSKLMGYDLQYENGYASFEIGARIGKVVPKKKTSSAKR